MPAKSLQPTGANDSGRSTYDMSIKIEPIVLKVTRVADLEAEQEMLNAHLVDGGHAVIEGESRLVSPDDASLLNESDYEWFETVVISLLYERRETAACGSIHPTQAQS